MANKECLECNMPMISQDEDPLGHHCDGCYKLLNGDEEDELIDEDYE